MFLFLRRGGRRIGWRVWVLREGESCLGGRRIGWSVWVLREGESCKGTPLCFQKEGQLWGLLSLYEGGVR